MRLFHRGALCAGLCLLAACTSPTLVGRGTYYADTSRHAQGADSRIRFLVMHYTESDEVQSLRTLTGDAVSAHYVVPERPRIERGVPVVHQLVPEAQRAWHAGVSAWQGTTELNAVSIGIENVNGGPADTPQGRTWQPYPPEQVDALIRLSKDIVARYGIAPTRVVGHSDIAPQRKIDPGPRFPWRVLAQAGVGAWPDDATVAARLAGRDPHAAVDVRALQLKLARYGYDVPTDGELDARTRRVFAAFQMHFRPSDCAGNPDAQTDAIAQALLDKYFPGQPPAPDGAP
ncbi:N-acetylmuramoyl-L-alanine amidase [Burkholderia stagnalis]|uniref:N-acetylmuramoyl-L-alanine amidase n=1 Tax=Burkholderia stagnalis TaxID=1503054 RepID=UPI00075F0021|nr:N-acetylmuramoyl-L-alanine amidase [Burkholderia stagnalis]KVL84273.1 N-acetylmuramoyl-L-alanine amidase [Burkholderia stagnalis]KVL98495.1 N-acetylmuramoyl-L-alanine amidase [Burkholderia stagnalis]KVM16786.1 N-acetylmuramoyl-L-alanine amidase [Burkholderia stagnalis]RQQ53421.1 N-acetylmuramoyl-L-alanine amidase [Burkholderia stagnalis]RQY04662.1 N-acetylmuramoyl-L-alanine amidase [Burkholderia stagnalis]